MNFSNCSFEENKSLGDYIAAQDEWNAYAKEGPRMGGDSPRRRAALGQPFVSIGLENVVNDGVKVAPSSVQDPMVFAIPLISH